MTALPARGLYAIADTHWIGAEHIVGAVRGAIRGGAVMIQLRDKQNIVSGNPEKLDALLALCRDHQVPFLINDDVELAATIQADGVHVGLEDGDLTSIRSRLGDQAIIGVSCHNDPGCARTAIQQSANYVAFGRFYPSSSKPDAPAADPETLCLAQRELPVPIVAIGGITADNMPALLAAGADLCAVISGIFAHGHNEADTLAKAGRYQKVMQEYFSKQGS